MDFLTILNNNLDTWHLLKHPLYQAWNAGTLDVNTLQAYAQEYYSHVAAFPRYLSSIHALCADIKSRQIILGNLIDEEQGEKNHPELWLRFAEGLDIDRQSLLGSTTYTTATLNLTDGYFALTKQDYATGLGALYAYERQTPEVAQTKIDGLKQYYNVSDTRSLEFFTVHMQADEWHTKEIAGLMLALSAADQAKAVAGATTGAKLLWDFLSQFILTNACIC